MLPELVQWYHLHETVGLLRDKLLQNEKENLSKQSTSDHRARKVSHCLLSLKNDFEITHVSETKRNFKHILLNFHLHCFLLKSRSCKFLDKNPLNSQVCFLFLTLPCHKNLTAYQSKMLCIFPLRSLE